MTQNNNSFAEL